MPDNWAKDLLISSNLARIIWNRGYNSLESAEKYLKAPLNMLTAPANWPQIPAAAELLAKELLAGKTMAVWGDYDADGITSTTLVLDVLEHHGFKPQYHLPDRTNEGYGLNIPQIEKMAAAGCQLLLTVDCGISNHKAVGRANELGMTVVVSDHHLPTGPLPPAQAIVNPRISEAGNWPSSCLAGVGVAFYLMAEVNIILSRHTGRRYKMDNALDLVALGTLADVMDLDEENRILVRGGLQKLQRSSRLGISALKEKCGLNPAAPLNSDQTVFLLAPRLNAAGRMGSPDVALQLLRSTTMEHARDYALQLNDYNQNRKTLEDLIHAEAKKQAEDLLGASSWAGLVLAGENWHSGIIGIVASRIVEEYKCPAIVLTRDGSHFKGSGRSIEGLDIHAALKECAASLSGFGGHAMAAGLRLPKEKLEKFRHAFNEAIQKATGEKELEHTLWLDAELDFKTAGSLDFLKELELMEPFGPGNPSPVFYSSPLRVLSRNRLGNREDSVRLVLREEKSGLTLPAKIWRKADDFPENRMKDKLIRLAFTPAIHCWNGCVNVELTPHDWELE